MRFTPVVTERQADKRTVTVAVRVDDATARAISVRSAIDNAAPVSARSVAASRNVPLAATKFDLGIARGYQGFAKKVTLPSSVKRLDMPDLAQFDIAGKSDKDADSKPSRFQPRVAIESPKIRPGRGAGSLLGLGEQTVDVSGAYRVTRNLDVTAGVRLSQDRDRIAPLTDAEADSQAVYVGTQFRF